MLVRPFDLKALPVQQVRGRKIMGTIHRSLWISSLFLLIVLPCSFALQTPSEEAVLVGHITHVEGEVLRYLPGDDDWDVITAHAPCGTDDLLYSDNNAKAEFIMPNNTWVRIGNNTQMHIIELKSDLTSVDIDSGIARLYNKSTDANIKATTPFGSITAPPRSIWDLSLTEDFLHLTVLAGTVDFVHVADNKHYGVTAGSSSLRAGYQEVGSLNEAVDAGWVSWNEKRDTLWEERSAARDESKDFLPEALSYESYTLEENGRWENVYYQGRHRSFWRPLYVSPYWSPFTVGRWTVWYDDHCWMPYEPFGYITHHYGNWIYLDSCNRWYWAPPVCHRGAANGSFLRIGLGWYPGRVSWIHRGGNIGWIPLAPFEPYYTYRYWGPRSSALPRVSIRSRDFHTSNCRYKRHAIIVKKECFYRVPSYHSVRLGNMDHNIIDSYRRSALVNSSVIKNLKRQPQQFASDSTLLHAKPNRRPVNSIRQKRTREGTQPLSKGMIVQKSLEKGRSAELATLTPNRLPGISRNMVSRKKDNRLFPLQFTRQDMRSPRSPKKQSAEALATAKGKLLSTRKTLQGTPAVQRQNEQRSPAIKRLKTTRPGLAMVPKRQTSPSLQTVKGQKAGALPRLKAREF